MKQRALNLLVALDIFLFCLVCLGSSKRNETASSAAWSLELQGKWQGRVARPLIDGLFRWMQKDHCRKAYLTEKRDGQE